MLIRALVGLLPIILLGCKLGPNYHIPANAVFENPAARAFITKSQSTYSSQEPPDKWWQLYHDPVLNQLMEEALCANTDLRVAEANIRRANALANEAKAALYPSTQLLATYANFHLSSELVQYHSPIPTLPFVNYLIAGGAVLLPLDFFGKLHRAIEASRYNREAAIAARDWARISVLAETASAYTDLCASGYQLKIAEQLLKEQTQLTDLTRDLQKGGRATTLDVTRLLSELEQVRATIPGYKASIQNGLYRLAALTGHLPAALNNTIKNCNSLPKLTRVIPIGNGASLLHRRPDIRAAERELAATTAKIGVEVANLYPDINLTGLAGTLGHLRDVGKLSTFMSLAGPLISWTFPNRSIAYAHIAEARAVAEAAFAKFDGVVLNALKEAETNLTSYVHDLERFRDLRLAHRESRKAFIQAKSLYSNGREGFLTVLEAEKSLTTVSALVAVAESKLVSDQVNLFLSLGNWCGAPVIP